MKNHIFTKYYLLIIVVFLFSSCEKIIDVDLKDAEPVLVVEGNISDTLEFQYIYLSKTVPFGADNNPVRVSDATVTVKEDNSTVYTFTESAAGVYRNSFKGKSGSTYQLSIQSEGKTYTSNSTMPLKVVLDSVSITQVEFFNEKRKLIKVHFQDPEFTADAYRYIISINNNKLKEFYVDNDRFNNGQYISRTINTDEPEIKTGDDISLDFQTIDLINYRYFYSLSQILGGGGPPVAPSNPDSNISNGAQGYFSAHTSQKTGFIVNN